MINYGQVCSSITSFDQIRQSMSDMVKYGIPNMDKHGLIWPVMVQQYIVSVLPIIIRYGKYRRVCPSITKFVKVWRTIARMNKHGPINMACNYPVWPVMAKCDQL